MDLLAKKFAIEDATVLETIKSGVGEANPLKFGPQHRTKRIARNIRKELHSMDVIRAVVKGAIIRKFWPLYSSILENVNTEE